MSRGPTRQGRINFDDPPTIIFRSISGGASNDPLPVLLPPPLPPLEDEHEVRQARDGLWYTRAEFSDHYYSPARQWQTADERWAEAANRDYSMQPQRWTNELGEPISYAVYRAIMATAKAYEDWGHGINSFREGVQPPGRSVHFYSMYESWYDSVPQPQTLVTG